LRGGGLPAFLSRRTSCAGVPYIASALGFFESLLNLVAEFLGAKEAADSPGNAQAHLNYLPVRPLRIKPI